jgi:O-antigen/teichoic acid export membrane protein
MVGEYALAVAVTAPIFAFTAFQLRAILATDATERFAFRDYLALRIAGTLAALLGLLALIATMPWRADTKAVVLAVAVMKSIDAFSDIIYGLLQKREQLDIVGFASALRGTCGLMALALGLAISHSAVIGLLCLSCAWIAVLLTFERAAAVRLLALAPRCSWKKSFNQLRPLAVLALPITFGSLLLNLGTNLPRIILDQYSGDHALGVFSAVATLSGALGLLYSAVGQTAMPRLSRIFAKHRDGFRSVLQRMLILSTALGVIMIAGAWFFGAHLVTAIYGKQASAGAGLVSGLVAIAVLNNTAMLLGFGLTASRQFWAQLGAAGSVLAIIAVSSLLLIPRFGTIGAMYSGLFGASCQFATFSYLAFRPHPAVPTDLAGGLRTESEAGFTR